MYSIDSSFLEQVGLSSMPEEQKGVFLDYVQDQLEVRVGEKMSETLSADQLDEFERIADNDQATINAWIQRLGDYKNDAMFTTIANNLGLDSEHPGVINSYVSVKWLSLNCPQYQSIIEDTYNGLKNEIYTQRDALLA